MRNSGVVAQGLKESFQIPLRRSSLLAAYGSMKPVLSRLCWRELQPAPEPSQQQSPPLAMAALCCGPSWEPYCPPSHLLLPPCCAGIAPLHWAGCCPPVSSTGLVPAPSPHCPTLALNESASPPAQLFPPSRLPFCLLYGQNTPLLRVCKTHTSHPGYAGILVKSDSPFFTSSF